MQGSKENKQIRKLVFWGLIGGVHTVVSVEMAKREKKELRRKI